MLPISVLIPTRDSGALMPGHLQALRTWIELAEEVVVVDSHSKDNTVELIRRGLAHPRVTFLSHPPGLYQSWNFGIQNSRAKYLYIATVGDSISRRGIEHLVAAAETFQSEVVVSKPVFMADEMRTAPDIRWPVDDLIEALGVTGSRAVSWLEVLLFTALHLDGTLLGSCASNLYRTKALRKFPFPADFGKAGDAAWAALHFADVKWAVTAEKFTTFLLHADFTTAAERASWKTSTRLDKVLRDAVETAAAKGTVPQEALESYGIFPLLDTVGQWMDLKQAFDRRRARQWPWYLNPAAWQARARRNHQRQLLQQRGREALSRLRGLSAGKL